MADKINILYHVLVLIDSLLLTYQGPTGKSGPPGSPGPPGERVRLQIVVMTSVISIYREVYYISVTALCSLTLCVMFLCVLNVFLQGFTGKPGLEGPQGPVGMYVSDSSAARNPPALHFKTKCMYIQYISRANLA